MLIPPRDANGFPIYAPTYENNQGMQALWECKKYICSAGMLSIFDEQITTQMLAQGGWYEVICDPANPTPTDNDYIEFSIVDKDDVLGLFASYGLTVGEDILELGKFLKTEYINPWAANSRQEFLSRGVFEVVTGLYFRTYYNSTGQNDVKIKVDFYVHES